MNCDLVIIGGGPAGLSAAINAASEGIKTTMCDAQPQFGGQAGTSSLIENLMGFPEGISGKELAMKSIQQASKFDVDFRAPFNAVNLTRSKNGWTVTDDDGEQISCKTVLLSMGVSYRSLNAKNVARFIGNGGISYGSPSITDSYSGKTVGVVGGANSAGQAAVYLGQCSECQVKLIIRSGSITDKMSTYLCNKIASMPNIEVIVDSEISEAKGVSCLSGVSLKQKDGYREIEMERLFILIGAKPKTNWLKGIVPMDAFGFICTGESSYKKLAETGEEDIFEGRLPLYTECLPGIFVAGDVRVNSVKRVAAALGEGSRAVNDVHQYLSIVTKTELV